MEEIKLLFIEFVNKFINNINREFRGPIKPKDYQVFYIGTTCETSELNDTIDKIELFAPTLATNKPTFVNKREGRETIYWFPVYDRNTGESIAKFSINQSVFKDFLEEAKPYLIAIEAVYELQFIKKTLKKISE